MMIMLIYSSRRATTKLYRLSRIHLRILLAGDRSHRPRPWSLRRFWCHGLPRHRFDWIEQCFSSPPTQYRLYGRRFLQVKRPNQHYQIGLPGVRFLTGQSGFLMICPVKNMMLNRTISCPVFWLTLKTARNLVSWFSAKSLKLLPPVDRFQG